MTIRIGTRASKLATWQAQWVAGQLRERNFDVEVIFLKTEGDVSTKSLGEIGGQGVFTKAIQRALLANEVDLAVHSLKDLPTEPITGLKLAASPPRERTGDALVSGKYDAFDTLPAGARIGTGSARRQAQLRHRRSDLEIADIRGNVDTRLKKLDDGEYDALVLAEAGLHRLELDSRIVEVLAAEWMLPAIGQGALGLETREDDANALAAAAALNDDATLRAVLAERAMLRRLQAGCLAPVGASCRDVDGELRLEGVVLSTDGATRIAAAADGSQADPESLGHRVADDLLSQGAGNLIHDAHD